MGHWAGDPECPGPNQAHLTNAQESDHGEDDASVYVVQMSSHSVLLGDSCDHPDGRCALLDTCCARSVAGKGWLDTYKKLLEASGVPHDLSLTPSTETFRLGDGRALESLGCVEVPLVVCGLALVSK